MAPSDVVQKAVMARSRNLCAFPKCNASLVVTDGGKTIIEGELAHIVAKSVQGPRGHLDVDPEDREAPENYVALCRPHHKVVDAHPLKYSVTVLRAMKEARERPLFGQNATLEPGLRVSETLYSSMLWIQSLPSRVFSADTELSFDEALAGLKRTGDLTPFWLHADKLWTFHDLADADGPFGDVVDRRSMEVMRADVAWSEPDTHRLYVNLLNRSLTQHLARRGIRFDRQHRRHYFAAPDPVVPVRRTYKTKSGRSQTREVVRQARFKDGTAKEVWWHLAARFRFEQVGPRAWYFTIRPEYHLTKDGHEPLEHQRIGRRITRKKSTLYNEGYLGLVHFWRSLLSDENPRAVLHAGQLVVIESHMVEANIVWPGVPSDEIPFTPDPFPENLFTLAEVYEVDDVETEDPFDQAWDEDEEGAV